MSSSISGIENEIEPTNVEPVLPKEQTLYKKPNDFLFQQLLRFLCG